MKYTHFSDLEVFEDKYINAILDAIFSDILLFFEAEDLPAICGSVAHIMHGVYSENYLIKDVDLEVNHWEVYRFLEYNLPQKYPNFEFSVFKNERLILYTEKIAIEFWKPIQKHTLTAFYNEKIKYTL